MNVYLYLDKGTVLHRMDPRAKMFLALIAFALAFVFTSPVANLVVLTAVLGVVSLAQAWSNVLRFKGLLGIILVMTAIMFTLTWPGETTLFWFIKQESLLHGLSIGLRVVALIITGLVFLSITTNEEILIALVRLGVPYRFSFALSTALRLVPTVLGTALVISQAQRCRGLDIESGNVITRLKNMVPILIPVFVSTIRSTRTFSLALDAKGFGAMEKRTFLLDPRPGRIDLAVTGVALLAIVGAFALRFAGVGTTLI